jgi:hypothetical protein
MVFSSFLSLDLPLKFLPNIPCRLSYALLKAPQKPLPLDNHHRLTAVFRSDKLSSMVSFPLESEECICFSALLTARN